MIIVRFSLVKELSESNRALMRGLVALEKKYDSRFRVVFDAIRQQMKGVEPRKTKSRSIGFRTDEGE